MSDTHTIVGKIKKVDLKGKSIEEFAKEHMSLISNELPSYFESYTEYLKEYYDYKRYFTAKGKLYEIIEATDFTYNDFCRINENVDETYSFVTSFYDGGTCLIEMLEDEMSNVE
jgi:hypothetical protein